MTLLMKKDFAARHGVGASAVSNWVKKGLIVFAQDPARPGKELIDAEKSDLLVRGVIDQTRGRPRAAEGAGSPAAPAAPSGSAPVAYMSGPEAVRMEEARERITGRRLDNEKRAGSLVSLDVVERQAADRGRMIRERVIGVVRAQQERIAAETDPRVIGALMIGEFEDLFARIADEIEAEARAEAQADAAMEAALPLDDGEAEEEAEAA